MGMIDSSDLLSVLRREVVSEARPLGRPHSRKEALAYARASDTQTLGLDGFLTRPPLSLAKSASL
jgi:hypothetical protein